MAAVDEETACNWCDGLAVLREPADARSGLFNQACKAHVVDLSEDSEDKPSAFIATPHGRKTLDMSDLVAWGVADVKPRFNPKTGEVESALEARLRANRECAHRYTAIYGWD